MASDADRDLSGAALKGRSVRNLGAALHPTAAREFVLHYLLLKIQSLGPNE